ncbi:LOW QUALITY PROTEIN: zinc finger protein 280A-like [Dugong dugon]
MAALSLCEEQEPEPQKSVKESKYGNCDDEDADLIFVGVDYHVVGAALSVGSTDESPHDLKQLSTSDMNSGNPKRLKLSVAIPGGCSLDTLSGISPTVNTSTPSTGVHTSSSSGQNEESFPQACANDMIHFSLRNPIIENSFEGLEETDFSRIANQHETFDSKKRNPIVFLRDFYYGKHDGDGQPEQKTHTTFKLSCLKILKNVKFMNHMKHHLELERQRGDSWDSNTTYQHCYRQVPTPFQLQRHIESVLITQEPSTVCKIRELSFETDHVLLQHKKDTHKHGEMPCVCQVCNYRSLAFTDVETHFRNCHEYTKNLLCPFCLKIFKTATPYMNHNWRHWNKTILQCSKRRLKFLTSKEKIEHETKNHQTFKKPEQLEGLPPVGGELIIQTSVQGSKGTASITVSTTDPWLSTARTKKRIAMRTRCSRLPCS